MAIRHWSSARRIRFGCGFAFGIVVGLLEAPRLQRDLRDFGVDQLSFVPAIPIILIIAVFWGLIATVGSR